jgi:hypothetical protein
MLKKMDLLGFRLAEYNCAQIVPVKVKFSQNFPKISKLTDKIYCIINMLKLRSF